MRIAKSQKNKFKVYFDRVETTPEVFNEDIEVRIMVKNALGEYWVNDDKEFEELLRKVNENDFEIFTNIFIYPAQKVSKFSGKVESSTKISGSLFS